MLFTGTLSVFRFNEFFLSVFDKTVDAHRLFQWQGINFHRSSGFMRVSLTYAGLLMLIVPFLFGSMFYLLFETKHRFAALFLALLNCCAILLLWLNGTRSASAALLLCAPVIVYFLIRDFFIKERIGGRGLKFSRILFFIFMLAALALVNSFLGIDKLGALGHPYKRSVNFRSIIWTQSGQMLLENPILGVGPGNYRKSALAQWNLYHKETKKPDPSMKNPIPTGHAHSDILHFAAIGGIPIALFFLFLVWISVQFALQKRSWQSTYLSCGCICFFIAGLAQCYFLDAEVVLLFWTLIALSAASPKALLLRRQEGAKQA